MKIAIVGLGIAGSTVLLSLQKEFNLTDADQIDIYEPRERLGSGFPYAEEDEHIVINTYPDSLSIVEGNRNDFIEWLKDNHPQDDYYNMFSPRTFYGEYLNERIQPALEHNYVQVIPQKVVDMRIVNSAGESLHHRTNEPLLYQVRTATDEWSSTYDAVFLTIGHPPYRDAYGLIGSENYIHNPYPLKDVLSDLPKEKRIGILGSGLTTLDILRYLKENHEFESPVTLYIRHEPFTSVIQPRSQERLSHSLDATWRNQQKESHNGTIPLENIFNKIEDDLETHGIDFAQIHERYSTGSISEIHQELQMNDENYIRFQAYLGSLYTTIEELINDLSATDREQFYRQYFRTVMHYYSQAPAESIQLIYDLIEEGKLRIISGLADIKTNEAGFKVQANGGSHQADILINSTGFENDLSRAKAQDKLIGNLYDRNLIVPDGDRNILVTWPQTQPVNRPFGMLDHVYLLGTWIFSTQLPNSSASSNIRQARKAVRFLAEDWH